MNNSATSNMSQHTKGFTLVELLIVVIILAILAAIVVPQFSNTTKDAQVAALDSNLASIRSVIDLYYQQHGSTYPSVKAATGGTCSGDSGTGAADSSAAFISQLSLYSNAQGQTCNKKDAGFDFGPYLKKAELPKNPITNIATLAVQTTGSLAPTGDGAGLGWKFDNVSGRFIANDTNSDGSDSGTYDDH